LTARRSKAPPDEAPTEGYANPTLDMGGGIPTPPAGALAHALPMARFDMMTRVCRRNADLSYRSELGMTLRECFCLSLVASAESKPFKRFCIETGLDKAQASRAASRLVELGLIERVPALGDLRSFHLRATPAGQNASAHYLAVAAERNRQLLSVLSEGQRQLLLESVELVIANALRLNADLEARG
jgi:DNA-binding MarR family transcriptional regulator